MILKLADILYIDNWCALILCIEKEKMLVNDKFQKVTADRALSAMGVEQASNKPSVEITCLWCGKKWTGQKKRIGCMHFCRDNKFKCRNRYYHWSRKGIYTMKQKLEFQAREGEKG